ncbi:Stage V sporulation protein R [Halorhabdus sp. SVX81]|uniref:SpoVR family protein n=1 Tax=Halorhabdus sp. SVX81 TaxID=2978283 RepID=UPI0023DBBC7D|nr:SpoVR family protein [Halorhabdus sp. SVX81]WEL17340.1 Stage V sporulation protein R [Halorhabdus sp. SVX81]
MSTIDNRTDAKETARRLREPVEEARKLARSLGLDPYPVNYWIVDHDEMNRLIAYGGFQERYPHWRWGMAYDRQRKQGQFLGGKAFEIVNNDNPAHAFLQESNALADQKGVITHVEAHADFFANNEWFGLFTDGTDQRAAADRRGPDATAMLARHADRIREFMEGPEIDREAVERWIDHVLCLEDTIDQHAAYAPVEPTEEDGEIDGPDPEAAIEELDLSAEVTGQVFDEAFFDERADEDAGFPPEPVEDLIGFLAVHGKQYDEETDRALEMTDWQREILELLRREAYYFAPQKMTKVMNEGWAAYWESMMMGEEAFAGTDEFLTYADHQARVLGSGGLNPYKLGKELWEYVENRTNRREVLERLLRVEGITWRNLESEVDFAAVRERLEPPAWVQNVPGWLESIDPDDPRVDDDALSRARDGDIDVDRYPWKVLTYEGLAQRHYSLVKPQQRGFLERASKSDLESIARYLFDDQRYDTVEAAFGDVDYTRGWDRMREIRESHNDVTFIDAFLTGEFVSANDYFAYEHSQKTGDFRVSSVDPEDVKRKLMLEFTNFGKPTIVVEDANEDNSGELLLAHRYNGVMLDIEEATDVLKRVFELWGRPVNLLTIAKEFDDREVDRARHGDREPDPVEVGKRLRYDGTQVTKETVEWETVEHLAADDVDYDTKPEEWL